MWLKRQARSICMLSCAVVANQSLKILKWLNYAEEIDSLYETN